MSLGYLWRRDQQDLLDEMIDCAKLEAIIVKVATLGLDQSHLGKSLAEIRPHLHNMVTCGYYPSDLNDRILNSESVKATREKSTSFGSSLVALLLNNVKPIWLNVRELYQAPFHG